MNPPSPSFSVKVDITNPGHVFACCGLLELSSRIWQFSEGWFDLPRFNLSIPNEVERDKFGVLMSKLSNCEITGLKEEELEEKERLKSEKKRDKESFPKEKEMRLKELGKQSRSGEIKMGKPFNLSLDWWESEQAPKTWAGKQEVLGIANAARNEMCKTQEPDELLDRNSILRKPDGKTKIEPFYFDSRRFADRRDVGFSLDAINCVTPAYPAVEFLTLVGMQRFRPAPNQKEKSSFNYSIWTYPLSVSVASAVFSESASLRGTYKYGFRMLPRDGENRYKGFSNARPMS